MAPIDRADESDVVEVRAVIVDLDGEVLGAGNRICVTLPPVTQLQ